MIELSNSGIRTISYDSGHVERVDVATSRAVRTGFNQAVSKISDANAEKLHAEYFEVSAHLTARPSHAVWQGKVYSREQLVEVCGLGTGPGLLGWNCRHSYYPFIPGISKRTYTDEQLEEIYKKSTETTEWRGKEYTGYEATQYQRMLERRMRVQDEKIRLMKPAGVDSNEIAAMKTKRSATYQEYKQFSEKMGLPEQMNRVFNSEVKHVKKTEEIPIEGSSSATKESLSPSPSSVYYITPESIKKSLGAVSKSEIPGTIDITDEWEHDESKPASECINFDSSFELNGVKYQIDGIKVKYEYDDSRASYWRSDCA
ncbi:phage minor capsid protein [Galactobacillus timonensis]|uniref:phage minor capsid protein n=1 Tax=Galactobacillus timonensis TaxID=2041840 RepID=UPI003211F252